MSWLAVVLWGGAVGVDSTSFPQAMFSRPLVAAALTGAFLGHPLQGAAVGVLLELFALVILPIGAARYPEAGTAAVAAAAAYVQAAGALPSAPLLALAIAFGLAWERLAGSSVNAVRRLNERLVVARVERRGLTAGRLERLHLAALAADFGRGALVAATGALVGGVLLRTLGPLWRPGDDVAAGVLGVAGATMLGAALPLFGGWGERRLAFGFGIVCGLLLLLSR